MSALLDKALALVNEIEAQEILVMELIDKQQALKATESILEATLLNEISSATDSAGKLIYSNEAKRSSALVEAKQKDKAYLTASKDLKTATRDVQVATITLSRLRNMFSAYKHLGQPQ